MARTLHFINSQIVRKDIMDTIDLSDVAEGAVVSVVFNVERDAGFNNTVDFYEVNLDGSVVNPASGAVIAPGEAGYTDFN